MNHIFRRAFAYLGMHRCPVVPVLLALAMAPTLPAQQGSDPQLQAEAQKQLNNKRFSGVQVQASNGVVTLSGGVPLYSDKMEAEKKIHHLKDVSSLNDQIRVQAPENASDQALFAKLSKGLTYDRVGYGTTVFNSITLQVHDGVVTVGGMVYGPPDKDSAIGLIANTPGVRDIVDNLKIAPLSPMDDRIRRDEARAIYGASQLNRYALDPAKTIRIVVDHGHVVLTGVVDSDADRNVAGIRANGVPGVFSVQNNLQVAGQANEH